MKKILNSIKNYWSKLTGSNIKPKNSNIVNVVEIPLSVVYNTLKNMLMKKEFVIGELKSNYFERSDLYYSYDDEGKEVRYMDSHFQYSFGTDEHRLIKVEMLLKGSFIMFHLFNFYDNQHYTKVTITNNDSEYLHIVDLINKLSYDYLIEECSNFIRLCKDNNAAFLKIHPPGNVAIIIENSIDEYLTEKTMMELIEDSHGKLDS